MCGNPENVRLTSHQLKRINHCIHANHNGKNSRVSVSTSLCALNWGIILMKWTKANDWTILTENNSQMMYTKWLNMILYWIFEWMYASLKKRMQCALAGVDSDRTAREAKKKRKRKRRMYLIEYYEFLRRRMNLLNNQWENA